MDEEPDLFLMDEIIPDDKMRVQNVSQLAFFPIVVLIRDLADIPCTARNDMFDSGPKLLRGSSNCEPVVPPAEFVPDILTWSVVTAVPAGGK